MTAISMRLKRQLPITAPAARFGAFNQVTADTPDASSGNDVIPAIRIAPIQARPNPVFSAITSPYFETNVPARMIKAAQMINSTQITLSSLSTLWQQKPCQQLDAQARY